VAPREARASEAVPRLLTEAVERVIEGDYTKARASLRAIDFRGLQRERAAAFNAIRSQGFIRDRSLDPELKDREGPSEAQKRQVYERDSFTCWFCGKRTIYAPVLMAGWPTIPSNVRFVGCGGGSDRLPLGGDLNEHRHPERSG
jgi:hypothetical protein